MASQGGFRSYSEDRRTTARLRASPSMLYNNLSTQGDRIIYAHMDQVWAVSVDSLRRGGEESAKDSKGRKIATICTMSEDQGSRMVQHVCPIDVPSGSLLALATSLGVQVYDDSGQRLKYFWPLPDKDAPTRPVEHCISACCWVRASSGETLLCAGSSSGRVYVFRMDHGGRFSHSLTLSGQQGAVVTALGSHLQSRGGRIESGDGSVLLAGDDSGRVVIYSVIDSGNLVHSGEIGGEGICVGLAARGDLAVVGSVEGKVKVYSLQVKKLRAEVVAHSRLMSSLAMHPTKDIVLSTAEDATVMAWALPTAENNEVTMLHQALWQSSVLTGASFCGDDIAVVQYDHEEAAIYPAE